MQGLTIRSLKKHPSLIPLFGVMIFGVGSGILYGIRVAVQSPDISWNRKKNPEPWNEWADKQYKLYYPPGTPKIECPAPKF